MVISCFIVFLCMSAYGDVHHFVLSNVLRSEFCVVMSVTVFLYLLLFVRVVMSYLRYLCLIVYSGVLHILCCVFCFVCFCLVYPMLSVSLDCPFLISFSVSCNVNITMLVSRVILLISSVYFVIQFH